MMLMENYLAQIPDLRGTRGRRYDLPHILLFSILAVLSGACSYRKIHKFMQVHHRKLNELFGLCWKRAPAHTSIRDILKRVEEDDFEQIFRSHSRALLPDEQSGVVYVAVDGKTLRGSFDHFNGVKSAHILDAFVVDSKIILGHFVIASKSNEIPAVQTFIQELGLSGCVFTMDAMHCQKKHLKSCLTQTTG